MLSCWAKVVFIAVEVKASSGPRILLAALVFLGHLVLHWTGSTDGGIGGYLLFDPRASFSSCSLGQVVLIESFSKWELPLLYKLAIPDRNPSQIFDISMLRATGACHKTLPARLQCDLSDRRVTLAEVEDLFHKQHFIGWTEISAKVSKLRPRTVLHKCDLARSRVKSMRRYCTMILQVAWLCPSWRRTRWSKTPWSSCWRKCSSMSGGPRPPKRARATTPTSSSSKRRRGGSLVSCADLVNRNMCCFLLCCNSKPSSSNLSLYLCVLEWECFLNYNLFILLHIRNKVVLTSATLLLSLMGMITFSKLQ